MFHGSMVALVTPMLPDGSLDFPALSSLIEYHIAAGTAAIVVVGTTGESATVDYAEHCRLIGHAVDVAAQRIPIIAGTGANSTSEAITLTRCAMEKGADACLLVTPYYNKPTQEGLFQHYQAIARAVPIPLILYNVPGRTAVDMLPETTLRLSSIANIIGIKEASGSVDRIKQIIAACGDRMDVYSGDDDLAMECMLNGAKGVISVTANVAPKQFSDMCKASIAGDRPKAELLHNQLIAVTNAMFVESNPIPVKWAVALQGHIQAGIRLPLTSLSEQHQPMVRDALAGANLL
ncbi:MAG: 4-hydroxy-tetrahydrodipicolinate synthase [Gammaproteobacteria bacterium]|nr:4-hydroxy-tetrahydrodipicolinate synthase [Gammaproteobacteria bacterium]